MRDSKGRIKSHSDWSSNPNPDFKTAEDKSRYVYVIEAKSRGEKRHLTVSSPKKYFLKKGSARRGKLYEVAREYYASYNFDISSMKLVSTWDSFNGREVRF